MPTFTAFTKLPAKDAAEALGLALEDMDPEPTGIGVFEIEDGSETWEVGGYFLEEPNDIELTLLAAAYGADPFVVSEVPDTDWVDKVRRDLTPVVAGRFFVYGSHDADKIPEGSVPLLIEAAMAFGTGHHGTTLGCLKAFDRLVSDGFVADSTVDIGCGTAVLAMAAASVFPNVALASDIDEVAVEVAEANVLANNMTGRVKCVEADGFDHPDLAAAAPYDLIFANILKGPLIGMAPAMAKASAPGGIVILSGILNPQADDVIEAYIAQGYNLLHRDEIVDWTTLTLERKRA